MRYVAAYMLAVLGGKDNPVAADIEKILSSVGIEADKACLTQVVKELTGKKVDEIITQGREKLSSMPVGGGVAATAAAPAGDAAAGGAKEEEKKEEKKKEDTESEDDDMGFGLFD